jgi:hypothetical protein
LSSCLNLHNHGTRIKSKGKRAGLLLAMSAGGEPMSRNSHIEGSDAVSPVRFRFAIPCRGGIVRIIRLPNANL